MTSPEAHRSGSFNEAGIIAERMLRAVLAPFERAGLAAAVCDAGGVIWSTELGWADLERRRRVTAGSLFRLGSISKPLTGACAARMAELGLLDLDRPIRELADGLPASWGNMTVRHVLTCTSGIAHYPDVNDAFDTTHRPCAREGLRRFAQRPLAHPPGERFTYSSYAYTAAAVAMEAACGLPFPVLMQRYLIGPAGGSSIRADTPALPVPGRVQSCALDEGRVVGARPNDLSGRLAGSGMLGTVLDLARVGGALTAPGLLSANTLSMLSESPRLSDGTRCPWGLGWRTRPDWDGRDIRWGESDTPGSSGGLAVCGGLALAVVCNARGVVFRRSGLQTLLRPFLAAAEDGRLDPAHRFAGSHELLDASGTRAVGTLVVEAVDHLGGTITAGARAPMQITAGFVDRRDGWLIGVAREEGLYPVRLRRTKAGMRAYALRERS